MDRGSKNLLHKVVTDLICLGSGKIICHFSINLFFQSVINIGNLYHILNNKVISTPDIRGGSQGPYLELKVCIYYYYKLGHEHFTKCFFGGGDLAATDHLRSSSYSQQWYRFTYYCLARKIENCFFYCLCYISRICKFFSTSVHILFVFPRKQNTSTFFHENRNTSTILQ